MSHQPSRSVYGDEFDDRGFGDVEHLIVNDPADIESAIAPEAAHKTVIKVAITEQDLRMRVVTESIDLDVVTEVDRTVLPTERSIDRTLGERLIGLR